MIDFTIDKTEQCHEDDNFFIPPEIKAMSREELRREIERYEKMMGWDKPREKKKYECHPNLNPFW